MCDNTGAISFLDRLWPLLEKGRLVFQPRNEKKTWEFMFSQGLREEDAFEIITNLGPEDYVWGPKPDDDGSPGEVWLFYYPHSELFFPFDRIQLYIKLKIWADADGDAGIVMSFHEKDKI